MTPPSKSELFSVAPLGGAVVLLLLLLALLSGCGFTPEGNAVRGAIQLYGAQAADAEAENLEWALCNGVSIGAVKRKYPPGSKKRAGYDAFCD